MPSENSDACSRESTPARSHPAPTGRCGHERSLFPISFSHGNNRCNISLTHLRGPGAVPTEKTAPEAMTLRKSAPAMMAASARAANPTGVLAIPCCDSTGIRSTGISGKVRSPPPPGIVKYGPAVWIRGPNASPPSIISRACTPRQETKPQHDAQK